MGKKSTACGGENVKDNMAKISNLNENCGFWDEDAAIETFKIKSSVPRGRKWNQERKILKDWKKQVGDADEDNCSNPENAVSTAWHLALLFNKFSDKNVFYRVATRDAMDYMLSTGCEDVYGIVESALKAYKSWGKVKNVSSIKKTRYPVKCKTPENGNKCEIEDDVSPIQITGYQYQV